MLCFYQILTLRSRRGFEQFAQCPQVIDADRRVIRQWHGRAGRAIKHPAGHLQLLKPAFMLERGVDARHASSCKRPISGYFQAEPGMPRVIDLQFGTMGFVSRGCTIGNGPINRSTTELRRPFIGSRLEKQASSDLPYFR